MSARPVRAGWLALVVVALCGCAAAPAAPAVSASTPNPTTVVQPADPNAGAYLNFATCDPVTLHSRTSTTQVYFFYAEDCAACVATDDALWERGVPDGLTVFKVDLPTMPELADRYRVTKPNTFVQVDANGEKVKSWTGAKDGADVAAHTAG